LKKHHPFPKSFKKIVDKHENALKLLKLFDENEVVGLRTQDHFMAHKLLMNAFPKGTKEYRSASEAIRMMSKVRTKEKCVLTPEEYEEVRRVHAENVHTGRKKSDVERQNISTAQKLVAHEVQNRPEVKAAKSKRMKGFKHSDISKQRMSEAQNQPDRLQANRERNSGENGPMFGRRHTEESKSLMSKNRTGILHTPEAREKMSKNGKIAQNRPEVKEKNRQGHLGKKASDEARENLSKAGKKRFEDPLECEKMSEIQRIVQNRPELKEFHRKIQKKIRALQRFANRFAKLLNIPKSQLVIKISTK